MIDYTGGFGFTAAGAAGINATVSGADVSLSWIAAPAADHYCVRRAASRSGFHTWIGLGCTGAGDPANTSFLDAGAVAAAGEWYYLVVPSDAAWRVRFLDTLHRRLDRRPERDNGPRAPAATGPADGGERLHPGRCRSAGVLYWSGQTRDGSRTSPSCRPGCSMPGSARGMRSRRSSDPKRS